MTDKITILKKNKLITILEKKDNEMFITTQNLKAQKIKRLSPVFENLLPEGVNREIIEAKYQLPKNDDFAVLSLIEEGLGDLTTIPKTEIIKVDFKQYNDYVNISDFAIDKQIYSSLEHPTSTKIDKTRLSMSGYQPKLTAVLKNNSIKPSLSKEYTNIIIKIANQDFPYIELIENIYLKVTKKTGLNSCDSFILYDNEENKSEFLRMPKQHLAIKRFDRDNNEPLECYELATLMQKTSKEKYDITLKEIFDFLSNIVFQEELNKVAHYYYISYIAKNGDAHLKNLTFIKKNNKFVLAPVYDIVNTLIYGIGEDSPLGIGIVKNAYNLKTDFTENELIELFKNYGVELNYDYIKQTFLENVHKEIKLLLKQDFINDGISSIVDKLKNSLDFKTVELKEKQVGNKNDGESFGGIGD